MIFANFFNRKPAYLGYNALTFAEFAVRKGVVHQLYTVARLDKAA